MFGSILNSPINGLLNNIGANLIFIRIIAERGMNTATNFFKTSHQPDLDANRSNTTMMI